jgi:L,D-transpeptidase catalytic domain/Putative peptidoglycan binding domain
MRRSVVALAPMLLVGGAPAAAGAQPSAGAAQVTTPPPVTTPAPAPGPAPVPPPAAGAMSLRLTGGFRYLRTRYAASGQWLEVVGSVRPYVANQVVTVQVRRRGGGLRRFRAPIRRRGGGGGFSVAFRAIYPGALIVTARHAATPQQGAFSAAAGRLSAVRWQAGRGARGLRVRVLQHQLRRLGYPVASTGAFGRATAHAVFVFRKVNRMRWNGHASTAVFARLLRGRGAFRMRYPRAGKHVEFDWSRQVLVLARGRRPLATLQTSSGKPSTPTIFGSYRFYRKQPGVNGVGMVNSSYFRGGYAIHGYPSVPTYPASHGCIRIPTPQSRFVMNWIRLGDPIFTYR